MPSNQIEYYFCEDGSYMGACKNQKSDKKFWALAGPNIKRIPINILDIKNEITYEKN
jgi:hypothetical protein